MIEGWIKSSTKKKLPQDTDTGHLSQLPETIVSISFLGINGTLKLKAPAHARPRWDPLGKIKGKHKKNLNCGLSSNVRSLWSRDKLGIYSQVQEWTGLLKNLQMQHQLMPLNIDCVYEKKMINCLTQQSNFRQHWEISFSLPLLNFIGELEERRNIKGHP